MQFLLFVIEYIPFWAIPLIFILIPTSVNIRRKDMDRVYRCINGVIVILFVLLAVYAFLGGPQITNWIIEMSPSLI